MSDESLLTDAAARLFGDLSGKRNDPFADLWAPVEEAAFPLLLVPEADGGFGGSWADAFAVLRLAGYHALPLPVGEAIVAAWLLSRAGLELPDGLATIAPEVEGGLTNGRFTGTVTNVPWGREAAVVVAVLEGQLIRLNPTDATVETHQNLADEPRDTLRFTDAAVAAAASDVDLFKLGALIRSAQIAGAMDAALAQSIAYANERVQFGKPIGKFQALQQNLAVFAEEAAAVNCAGQAAFAAAGKYDGAADFEVAAAKLRANMAIGIGTSTAHQVHGAIGFTKEYSLHPLTRRLWAWRSEFGSDAGWSGILGKQVIAAGADAFWPTLTERSDP
ncbi:MAG TPA: acyl-CoA dehydrogenase family protein [Alphaproteobacteria bacterium]|jgi:acyl-CoA dehydrogenase|nr:acyl-CoA dehydrogenase family protein [Alphaproteobacteria bacterium]